MAYPFAPMPSLRGFITILIDEFGVEEKETKLVVGPRGRVSMKYLLRECPDGKRRVVPLPNIRDDERLTPNQLRALCSALDIPKKMFGFDLE